MHQRAISLQQWADLYEVATITGRADAGPIASTTGHHPLIGAFSAVEDWREGLIILSELPIPAWMLGRCCVENTM